MSDAPEALLIVNDLHKHYAIDASRRHQGDSSVLRAVDGVSFAVRRGETVGLVGESGCGKSTTGKCLLRIEEPTSGDVVFDGRTISGMNKADLRQLRQHVQMVFQDPFSSLNPRKKVWSIVTEALQINAPAPSKELRDRAKKLLETVGLKAEHADRYPHQFSGGQRQRIGIARALALRPTMLVLDEPVSALDVSIQAAIINLLQDLQSEFELTYLFISHDLAVVRHLCDRVAVMYLGKVAEMAPVESLFTSPGHPYTRALLEAIPEPDVTESRERNLLEGDVPSPLRIPSGCRFKSRCPERMDQCDQDPPLAEVGEGHFVRCWLAKDSPQVSESAMASLVPLPAAQAV